MNLLALIKGLLTTAVLLAVASEATETCLAETYIFDSKRAEVQFTYYVGPLSQSGRFTELSGLVEFDQRTPERGSVNAVIKTASLAANHWEEQLKGRDFFNIAVWPEIRFKSREMRPTDGNHAELMGDLTMNGVTHPVTLQMEFNLPRSAASRDGEQPIAANAPQLSATTRIRRSSFNMTALSYLVDDEINIQITSPLKRK